VLQLLYTTEGRANHPWPWTSSRAEYGIFQ